ncbi:DeoR family transcriptional regulator [uncultured Moraxella sp.]|nr:DeoR family transcriptional regulator [uncultured Moraxella sp.]
MINKLWGDFYGKLTTKKWASITKVSTDTALRDINDLVEKGILVKSLASGRSQSYELSCLVE